MKSYVHWRHHGEQSQKRDNNKAIYSKDENKVHDKDDGIRSMLEEVAEGSFANYSEETGNNVCSNMSEKEATTFDKLLKEVERELYPGCKKFLKLSFLVKFLHLQVYIQWSNKLFDMLLELLKEALPTDKTLSKSYYDAKNMLQGLGLGYILIHACKNNYLLY
ncbi:26S proteasome regulatory subunit 8-like [Capsicum annuum]